MVSNKEILFLLCFLAIWKCLDLLRQSLIRTFFHILLEIHQTRGATEEAKELSEWIFKEKRQKRCVFDNNQFL